MVERPFFVHPPARPPPPDRTVYGTSWPDHVETEHFTIQWWSPNVREAEVRATGEALERSWRAFIDEQGWPAPVSSDQYYLWVLLDPDLGSTTGYTTEYADANYPDGIPIIYLNSTTLDDFGARFYAALAAHELMHAIQFGMRDYDWRTDNTDLENWYWEASATHGSELADPTVDGHQYASEWYADQAHLRYDSYVGSHQYGMFVLNAWLDDVHGPGTMLAVWQQAVSMPAEPWPKILESALGMTRAETWAGFTHAFGNQLLPESDRYASARLEGDVEAGAGGTIQELGTHYWRVSEDIVVEPDSDGVILGGASVPGAAVRTDGPGILTVTALHDDTSYTLSLSIPSENPDTGGPPEGEDRSADDFTATGVDPDTSKRSGCSTIRTVPVGSGLCVLALALVRRRRQT